MPKVLTEEIMGDQWEPLMKVQGYRERNSAMVDKLESMGSSLELTHARIEHFMASLVHMGVLTPEQYVQLNLEWEKDLQSQLQKLVAHREEQIEQAVAERRKQIKQVKRPGLILPNGAQVPRKD